MLPSQLSADVIVRGASFPEDVRIIMILPHGNDVKFIGTGCQTRHTYELILTLQDIEQLQCSNPKPTYDGYPRKFRLGIESRRLALAHEYDPYFALSIARVDPLPHQLEAVYDYFLKSPRIRFLLADDPGAGKTIMAGLLLKELKIRGLVQRTLIITPANLSFQWQRELKEKFREKFTVMRGAELRANYGTNPWQDHHQVITSISWASIQEDARESLLRSQWDLIVVDEAHKMSATQKTKTYAYELGEKLSKRTDHYLLMTATPHKGVPENFCLFLELLDRDVYGNVKSLEDAMKRHEAPFYLRRTKEALVTFPDPQTGQSKRLFTRREVKTVDFKISDPEMDLYELLTRFVEDQSIRASHDNSSSARALGFTMAMLQRRFASSIHAVRCSLERMRDRRKRILEDPEKYRQEQIAKKLPDDFDEMEDAERQEKLEELEGIVASINPGDLKNEVSELEKLIGRARFAEQQEIETKLAKLKEVLTAQGIFKDPKMKLLIFTEHKDTLDYLAGNGKDGRPLGKLREWGLNVTQIHGGMKIGDRDTPGTRIYAEREFREDAQVLVATEAAGEGINLQFCWFMVNYDIPWNPIRLEQRMGRIHRYGQEKECLIYNFVSTNTAEGRVLRRLFERLHQIETDLDPEQTGMVFNVLGDIFPSNDIERMLREMYAKNISEKQIDDRIVREVDIERFRQITHSTLEGLAKRELNLSAILGKYSEARERRLVPEVVEDFFMDAADEIKLSLSTIQPRTYKIAKLSKPLKTIGEIQESKFGALGKEYKRIVFDRKLLEQDARSDWVTPGHPLFEAVRQQIDDDSKDSLARGAVFYDLHAKTPYHLDVYVSSVFDGLNHCLNKTLLLVEVDSEGNQAVREPTLFLDLQSAKWEAVRNSLPESLPDRAETELFLTRHLQSTILHDVATQRKKEVQTIRRHVETSLEELIKRQNILYADIEDNPPDALREANLSQAYNRLDELTNRRDRRRYELAHEEQCSLGAVELIARAWVLPSPDRNDPEVAPLVRDDDIERIAVDAVIAFEEARGWQVESVEKQNRGFDLISRHPQTDEHRYIEVKGRADVGEVALSNHEFKTAAKLQDAYWLYTVFRCSGDLPEVHLMQNPAVVSHIEIERVVQYVYQPQIILESEPKETP